MDKLLAVLLLGGCASTTVVAPMKTSPAHVYKLADPGGESTESCTFMVILPGKGVPVSARFLTLAGTRELESRLLTEEGVRGLTISAGARTVIRLQVRRPKSDSFDRVQGTVHLRGGASASFDVPVSLYEARTKLVFPFQGNGLISSAGVNDGGHRNSSGQFAIDAIALTDDYAPMICGEDRNECSAGFGSREIRAPGDGAVVRVWNDIADNTSWDGADRALFTRPDGTVIDTGNSVVIDHGNGEFSVVAHMKQGSVTVSEGQSVKRGQKIGLLGNSGESYGPHVHYQLQNGSDLSRADALPARFEGGPSRIVRGAYFTAR